MHIRTSRVRRNGKTYEYAQLVESYRRPDGMPVHRVVATLRSLSPEQIKNLKLALVAGRQGQQVTVDDEVAFAAPRSPVANLRYLDLAVLVALAGECGLSELLASLLPKGEATVAPADVVLSLVVQRCVDPGSKLYAERWFPRTALPELLGIAPDTFNNTRLHRVLDELDAVTPDVMTRLPRLYLEQSDKPAFAAMYVDLTDAHFVGHGPELAKRGKTKEGILARKIGILLLCNDQGYPLRWTVLEGNRSDSAAMTDLFQQIANTPWAQKTPIVCDRAMGHTAQIEAMDATGLRFLTALTTAEFESYAPGLPVSCFQDLQPTESTRSEDVTHATESACKAGFVRVTDTLWFIDYGVVERRNINDVVDVDIDADGRAMAKALQLGRNVQQAVNEGRFDRFAAASRSFGITPSMGKKYRRLLLLPVDVQQSILDGEAERSSLGELLQLLSLPSDDLQRDAYRQLILTSTASRRRKQVQRPDPKRKRAPLRVRVVAYFNPERFVEQCIGEARKRDDVDAFIEQLNRRLDRGRSRRRQESILSEVDRRLRRNDLVDAFDVRLETVTREDGKPRDRVTAHPVSKAWERRRRHYGISILVGHRDLCQPAGELCQLYRDKDRVEKDFQTIKSVIELRPIRHRTDDKVRAHVTLCMLALLLERQLEIKLEQSSSAARALEELASCHLNLYRGSRGSSVYALTETTTEQRTLLRKLGARALGDPKHVPASLTPRLHLRQ